MLYTLPLLLLLSSCFLISVAQDAPRPSPEIRGFNLSPDNVGAIANTVNLYTGDLALPLSLISIPGRNGLDVGVSIMYNSGVQNQVDTWNLEAPAGILGLGWNMDIPKIIADTKQTGTREDDTYYIAEGGSSNRLIRTLSGSDATGSYYVYETKNYQFWKIKYYYDNAEITGSGIGPNKWEITKENGMKYIYGDKNSGRSTIQYTVRWDNWIGNSAQPLGQSQLANAWNLSEIVNLMGEKITFEYTNVEQFVGSLSGLKHTEASYLKQITDVIGRKVQFFYSDKQAQFYAEPHTEKEEPDAYQEVYEKKYLDHIDVLQEAGTKQMSVNFKYSVINSGTNTAKMLLGYIEQRNSVNQAQPGIQFDYSTTSPTKGFLQKVTYPTGGTVSYSYKLTSNSIDRSLRSFTATAPSGYGEPKLWFGNDYVVVTWRSMGAGGAHDTGPQTVRLSVYQWVGEWKEQFLQTIGSVSAFDSDPTAYYYYDYKDFQVVVEDKFFAVLSPAASNSYNLFIRYKDESIRGQWLNYSPTIDYGTGVPTLLSGEDFVSVGSYQDDSTHPSHLYSLRGDSWHDYVLNQTSGDHFYASGNNYFFSHNRVGTSLNAEMNFSFLTEDKKWVTRNWANSLTFGVSTLQNNRSYWHGSNSYMVAMANDNPEYIYRWDLTYSNFFRDNNILGTWADDSFVFNLNNEQVGIVQKGSFAYGRTARFDGKYWYPSTDIQAYYQYRISFGEDYAIWTVDERTRPVVGFLRTYSPNTLSWNDQDFTYTPNETLFGNSSGHNPLNAGPNFFTFSDKVYFRKTNGSWTPDFTLTAPVGVTLDASSLKIGGDKYFVYRKSNGTYLQFIKNGTIGPTLTNITGKYDFWVGWDTGGTRSMTSPNTIVTYSSPYISDATGITLYRILDNAVTGKQVDHPVSLITANDGIKDTYTSFDYNFATAVIDPSGSIAQYNKITVIPGSATVVPAGSGYTTNYGYTTTYFHNGLTATDMGVPFEDFFDTDLRWAGSSYRTKVYDKNNNVVSVTNSTLAKTNKDFLNSDGTKVDVGFYVRPYQSTNTTDNLVTCTTQSFDANTGQLKTQHVGDNVNSQASGMGILNEYTYWWEKYDPTRTKNILVGPIQTSRKVNGVYTESQVSRYKNWNASLISSTVPGAFDSYVWKGTGALPDAFTAWDVATTTPSSTDWQYGGKVVSKDDYVGIAYESSTKGDVVSSTIWDQYKIRPLAVVGNASYNQVAYAGFEDASQGNWSWSDGVLTAGASKTGLRYLSLGNTGLTKSGLTTAQKYVISFWAKSSSGAITIDGVGTVTINSPSAWTYYEYTVTNLSAITVKKSGATEVQLDELRLHPSRALMKTFSYHPLYGVASETNSNNETSYTEYDEWGRVKNILDENKNIIKTNTYYTKN